MSGIYIHIPFCRQACSYCDFYFVTRQEMRGEFVSRLCDEIDRYGETAFADEPVETVYIGGGTPSLLSASEISAIFSHLEKNFSLRTKEVTMELNPDDVTVAYLKELQSAGITRASMGVQTFDPDRLGFMNRAHNPSEAVQALNFLREAGFSVFTADLIYGNPGQTVEELDEDIDRLLEFDPPHISAYALTIEPGTRLGKQVESGRMTPAGDDQVADHFDLLTRKLPEKGLHRYEISSYSKKGFEAIHNRNYWHHKNYLGLGPSAHSFWWGQEGARRWKTVNSIRQYLDEPFDRMSVEKENLPLAVLAEERLMLGLRTRQGILIRELDDRYGYSLSPGQREWLGKKADEGLVFFDGRQISLTTDGLKLADHLVVELLLK
ncbi:MAG: radical SAM family heme chaperone HemW [Balneolaceae bacterium]